jgi:hypothetical protein
MEVARLIRGRYCLFVPSILGDPWQQPRASELKMFEKPRDISRRHDCIHSEARSYVVYEGRVGVRCEAAAGEGADFGGGGGGGSGGF